MGEPTITDWIQAIAASIGVIGLIVTVWKLYQKDKERDDAFKNISRMTTALVQKTALEEKMYQSHKNRIKPLFVWVNTIPTDETIDIVIKNIKEGAFSVTIEGGEGSGFYILAWTELSSEIKYNQEISFKVIKAGPSNPLPSKFHFAITYRDIDSNFYRQHGTIFKDIVTIKREVEELF